MYYCCFVFHGDGTWEFTRCDGETEDELETEVALQDFHALSPVRAIGSDGLRMTWRGSRGIPFVLLSLSAHPLRRSGGAVWTLKKRI